MNTAPQTLEEIFHSAVSAPTLEERNTILAEIDPALRARLDALLLAHDGAANLFKLSENIPSISESIGSQIGHYALVRQIGEGGFAVVFAAEQQAPVRRTVALKIIKPGMDSRQIISRFNAERQALAIMDHPNIAKVFDAGLTTTGWPYFVMELIPDGFPITTFCDTHRLSVSARLELFSQGCAAVQHAHQKGIIHRDIKPSNMLVHVVDGKPIVKVIDFGIAKATSKELSGQTFLTEFGQLVGTPEYMSPEQADGRAKDVDTRSDIYSLGVLLFELLVGTTPFDARALRSKAFAEILRVIREDDPPRPSTRLQETRDTIASVAAARQLPPDRLTRLLRGDLDWVVIKCLEKEPARRYDSAAALASDLTKYLNEEPLLACPPGNLYRFRKMVRRHRATFTAAAVIALTVLIGLIVSIRLLVSEHEAHRRAVEAQLAAENARVKESAQRQRAEAHLAHAREIAELITLLAGSESRQSIEANAVKQEVLDKIASNLQSLTADGSDDVQSLVNLAEAYDTAAVARIRLNQLPEAQKLLLSAIDTLRSAVDRVPGDRKFRQRLAEYYFILYEVTREQGDRLRQAEALRNALVHERFSHEQNQNDVGDASHYAWLLTMYARSLTQIGKIDEAIIAANEGVSLQEELLKKIPGDLTRLFAASDAHFQLACVFEQGGRYMEALAEFERHIEIGRQHLAAGAADTEAAFRLCIGMEYAVSVDCLLGRFEGADSIIAEELNIVRHALASAPNNLDLHERMMFNRRSLGYVRFSQGRHDEAITGYLEAEQESDWLVNASPSSPEYRRYRIGLLIESAEPSVRNAKAAVQHALDHLQNLPRDGRALGLLADAEYQVGDIVAASAAMARAETSDNPPIRSFLYLKAILQRANGQNDKALQTFAQAEAGRDRPLYWETLREDAARKIFAAPLNGTEKN